MQRDITLAKITQKELVEEFKRCAGQMVQDPEESYKGLLALRALLTRYELRYNLGTLSADLTPRILTLVWLLQRFVNGELWKNFGQDDSGFPKDEGGPLIDQISQDLGRFILWFLNEGEVVLGNLMSAVERYFQLLRVTEHAHVNLDPGTQWVKL